MMKTKREYNPSFPLLVSNIEANVLESFNASSDHSDNLLLK